MINKEKLHINIREIMPPTEFFLIQMKMSTVRWNIPGHGINTHIEEKEHMNIQRFLLTGQYIVQGK